MKLSTREKNIIRQANTNQRIRYNVHKAKEHYSRWSKQNRRDHDKLMTALNVPILTLTRT